MSDEAYSHRAFPLSGSSTYRLDANPTGHSLPRPRASRNLCVSLSNGPLYKCLLTILLVQNLGGNTNKPSPPNRLRHPSLSQTASLALPCTQSAVPRGRLPDIHPPDTSSIQRDGRVSRLSSRQPIRL